MNFSGIASIKFIGDKKTIDLEVDSENHNFYCNDICVSNSHSAAYSTLAARTVLLKSRHPQEFFISVLESSQFEPDPLQTVSLVQEELRDFGIKLLPPSLERSEMNFAKEDQNIRYGLNSIKGISEKSLEALLDFRGTEFLNKYEAFSSAKQSGISIAILSALIQAGAMGREESDRSRLVLEAQAFNLLTEREKRNFCKIGEKFGYDILNSIAEVVEKKITGDDNKPIMPEKRFETFKRNFEKYKETYKHNKKHAMFSNWWYETTLLGYSHSTSLKECFFDEFGSLIDTQQLKEIEERETFKIVVQVQDMFSRTSAAGNKYMNITGQDEKGLATFLFMDNNRGSKLSDFLEAGGKIKKEDVVALSGSKSGDAHFVDKVKVIDTKIYMRPSQLK